MNRRWLLLAALLPVLTGCASEPATDAVPASPPVLPPAVSREDSSVLVISSEDGAPYVVGDGSGTAERLLVEAAERCGLILRLVRMPSERSLRAANAGQVDGEMLRVAGLETHYPHLLCVPEPLVTYRFTAFAAPDDTRTLDSDTWADLAPYRVGFVHGWKLIEFNLGSVRGREACTDIPSLLAMLDHGRIDLVVHEERMLAQASNAAGHHPPLRRLQPPLAVTPMYLYLHERHAGLVPRLAAALRAVKAELR